MSGKTFIEKTFVSQIFLLSWIFSGTGRKIFKTLSCFVQQGHGKSNLCVRMYFVTKNILFQRTVFFYNCFRTLIGKVCTFEIINCLGCINSVLRVVRNVLGKKFCSKNSIFVKNLPAFERKIFWLLAKLFPARLSSFHSTFAEEGFRENSLEKIFFFIVSRLEARNCYWKNIRLNVKTFFYVSGGSFSGKTYFLKLFDIFFLVFWAKNCNFWKKIPRNCKKKHSTCREDRPDEIILVH